MRNIKLVTAFILLLLLVNIKVNAQVSIGKLDSIINTLLENQLNKNLPLLKDSNNLYAFAIKINLTRINSKTLRIDSISTNDSAISKLLFSNLETFKKINYSLFLRSDQKIKLIKPVLVLIGSKELGGKSTAEVYNQNCKLFYIENNVKKPSDSNYNPTIVPPFISSHDLKIYD